MWALITGASSGIGRDMARYLCDLGYNLVITSSPRSIRELKGLKKELSKYVEVVAVSLDLSKDNAPYKLYKFCKFKKIDIDILINNAGFGVFGSFDETSLKDELNLINVNVKALHILTKLFLKDLKAKNYGYILNVSSSAGFMTGPLLSSYYASKNYVLRLSLAIREELRQEGSKVHISVLCPGPVDTNFNNRAGVSFSIKPLTSEYVSKCAIDGMFNDQGIIIPSISMKLGVFATRFIPYELMSKITYNIQKRKFQ